MVIVYAYSDIIAADTSDLGEVIALTALLDGSYGLHVEKLHYNPPNFVSILDSMSLQRIATLDGDVGAVLSLPKTGGQFSYQFDLDQLSNGGFVQVAHGFNRTSLSSYYLFQLTNANGKALGPAVQIGTDMSGGTDYLQVESLTGGGFLVSWNQYDFAHPTLGWEVRFQTFDNRGHATSSAVTRGGDGDQGGPAVTMLNNGHVAEVWIDSSTANYSLKAEVLATDGSTVSGIVTVDEQPSVGVNQPQIAALADGGFVLTWHTTVDDETAGTQIIAIKMQVFNANGTARSALINVDHAISDQTGASNVYNVSLTALPDGRFAIGWDASTPLGGSGNAESFLLRIFSATGATDSALYSLGEDNGHMLSPLLAALADGRIAASWLHSGQVETQILDSRDHAIHLTGNALAATYVGTTFNDTIGGVVGNDTIAGWSGADRLYGGRGADLLYGDKGNDRLFGGNGADVIFGGKGNDLINGGAGDDSLNGDLGKDTFVFAPTDGHDQLTGFEHAIDRLDLRAFHFASFDAAASHFATQTGGLLFTLASDSIAITGLTLAQLSAADLIL